MGQIGVLIDAELYNELVLRTRSREDVSRYVEHALETFLERTSDDEDLWSANYIEEMVARRADKSVEKFGSADKGYHWQLLFLPNGTRLRMTYRHKDYFAEVRHQKITDGEGELSPSEWASKVANHTSRNAWRDIWVLEPGQVGWELAEIKRERLRKASRN